MPNPTPDVAQRLLKAEDAMTRLGCSRSWLYRHADRLGAVREGRFLRFPERGIADFVEARSHAEPARLLECKSSGRP
jgi:predicted DNA-binding transcriptional regulator AlpA